MSRNEAQQSVQRARQLRKDSTFPERLLWSRLRGSRLCGLKFRRQHPIDPYIVDFYCQEASLAVELDGDSHNDSAKQDQRRTEFLEGRGLRILRFLNDDVLRDIDSALTAILIACNRDPETGAKK
ncbi:MAG: DUF559 domain-containing protein [Pirellulales bacterium]